MNFKGNMVVSLLFLAIIISGCTKAAQNSKKMTPVEEMILYAHSTGGKWFSELDELSYSKGDYFNVNDLKRLSEESLKMIRKVHITRMELKEIPDLYFLPSLTHLDISSNEISDLSPLEGLNLTDIIISENPYSDITTLAQMSTLEDATLGNSSIEVLPDLSNWKNMKGIGFSGSTIKSLKNLETIPSDFDLWIWECDDLTDIDALRYARVNTLFIDEVNYERLKPWFDKYVEEIKERRPQFNIRLDMFE
ncbi:MAG: hypothetical protein L3J12_02395 [Spirochaetales bacterium]|nr:hypothetical protein [Spirochaetales bacterium]